MEGFIEVKQGMIHGWKKSFFILKDKILSYFNIERTKNLGKIHMSVATLLEQPEQNI